MIVHTLTGISRQEIFIQEGEGKMAAEKSRTACGVFADKWGQFLNLCGI